jgi:hypothetical protein
MEDDGLAKPFRLSVCHRCNAAVLPSLAASHDALCEKNVRAPPSYAKRSSIVSAADSMPCPPSNLLYMGSGELAGDDCPCPPRGGLGGMLFRPPQLGEGDASALYHNISMGRVSSTPSSVVDAAESVDELECTARPPSTDTQPPPALYARLASTSPSRSSALRSLVDHADDADRHLESYPTAWDTVLKGSPEQDRLDISPPVAGKDLRPVGAAAPRISEDCHTVGPSAPFQARRVGGDVFLPYLHNRHRVSTQQAPLNHRPFMLVGKATVSKQSWGGAKGGQGPTRSIQRPSSAGPPPVRGSTLLGRRSSHMPAAPRMAATGRTPRGSSFQPPVHIDHLHVEAPATARQLLPPAADELETTTLAAAETAPLRVKTTNARSGSGKVVIHRPTMLLSPRKEPRQTPAVQHGGDIAWTPREVKPASSKPVSSSGPTPRVAVPRSSSAQPRFIFPPSLRAMHPQVASKRPSSVVSVRGGVGRAQPPPSNSISPDPIPPGHP